MKTQHLLTAIFLFAFAQFFGQEGFDQVSIQKTSEVEVLAARFKPVYFNYHLRKLYYNGKGRISGAAFLELCRTINDSAVQYQISRYDGFTRKKGAMLIAMAINGVVGLVAVNAASAMSVSGEASPLLITAGVLAILSAPVLAIATTAPHQKRKAVLFRDLPIAYNHYVESLQYLKQK
jgi:hypothetical protein